MRFVSTHSKEELKKTPSVLSGMDLAKELSYRQQSANLIQDMGQRLGVTQLTINTAIVYMHRFYMFHSFSTKNRNVIAPCCLFLSAKLEEQPRKLEYVIKVAHACLHRDEVPLDTKSEKYSEQAQELVINESVLLETLGFELTVDHPHTHVVRITQLVRASKDLAQTSYFMATNSLHLTSFCIQHKPSVVACVCIHLACKWSNWEFPRSSDNKDWWEYADPTVTKQSLDTICQEFLNIIESCPSRLKRRINTVTIYKGGHHKAKMLGETSTTAEGEGVSNNGTATSSKEDTSVEKTNKTKKNEITELRTNDTTLTITSSEAVVETATSKVTLPPLPPLTTKYANMPTPVSTRDLHNKTRDENKLTTKHKHREQHDDPSSPSAKKLKTLHSNSSRGSHTKHGHPGKPSSQPRHSAHQSSRQETHHLVPKLVPKTSSLSLLPQVHHSKRPHSGHSSSHSGNKLPHKHRSDSPLDVKKSSGDRHRRPSSGKPKSDLPLPPAPIPRVNDLEQGKTSTKEGFISPPGLQRLPVQKLQPLPNPLKHSSHPPLPMDNQAAPPPPPPPCLPPPPPPPPT